MALAVIRMNNMKIRLDKYLADMGMGTRSEVKKAIGKGLVSVDGCCVKKSETKIDTDCMQVTFGGQAVGYLQKEYYMLHKPAGVISATEDSKEKTVLDLIETKKRKDLFPVGRLDKDTEGLLLITNDGELAHRLLSPKKHVEKVYYAKVQGFVTEEDIHAFAAGVDIQLFLLNIHPCLCSRGGYSGGQADPSGTVKDPQSRRYLGDSADDL